MNRLALALALVCGPVWGETLSFPSNATLTAEEVTTPGALALASDGWANGTLPVMRVEGDLRHAAWRIDAPGLTTVQVLRPLREQLALLGYDPVFECGTDRCGGFDFRYAIPVLPPPEMQVNLADFRYLSAVRPDETALSGIAILVSRTPDAAFVQVSQVGEAAAIDTAAAALRETGAGTDDDLETRLTETGRAVLDGLVFATGSAVLAEETFPSLAALADVLATRPDLRVALVGHTDAEGSLEANIALSKRRAGAVLERLVTRHGVPRRQLTAEGNGYLAPVASNLTPEGREANRRVEVIVLSER